VVLIEVELGMLSDVVFALSPRIDTPDCAVCGKGTGNERDLGAESTARGSGVLTEEHRMKQLRHRSASGFSLLELMIVVGIMMVIAAMAMPKLMTTIADVRMRGAVNSASGLMQQSRMLAIKDNMLRKVKYSNVASGGFMYVDVNDDGVIQATEPQVQMGSTIMAYSAPTGLPALIATNLGYTPATVSTIMFNPRGIPCSAVNTCGAGMVVYFTDSRNVGSPGWGAVSVSPAGRVKTWMWTGSAWGD
jgi:Tfp pilus assembly protein FimT